MLEYKAQQLSRFALLVDIAKHTLTGNCSLLNSKGRFASDGIRGILGRKTSSPLLGPVTMATSMQLGINFLTMHLVPLQRRGGSTLHNTIMGTSTLSFSICGGIPEGSKEFRNSVGYVTMACSSEIVSTDL